ncbi:acyltransferase family protein [Devosia sp. Root685]|uniref:acyltransferase family protein n=1 Tax=Devosia sp. Root685 TaxID=1736587 RepID=UPI000AB8071D|nr:acyltransferase family protein [Devosia sp. Root685]
MTRETGRLDWVDAARGIGIVLVVFGHVWRGLWEADILTDAPLFAGIDAAIYLFHMPLFFLVSGMFFEKSARRDGVIASILKRCETLLYPLLIWSWILAAFLLLAAPVATRHALTPMEALLFPFPPKDIFWFLWALFLIQLLCLLLVRATTQVLSAVLVLSFAAAVLLPMLPGTDLFHGAFANLPFFLSGVMLTRRDLFGLPQTISTGMLGAGVFVASLAAAAIFGLQPAPLGTFLSLLATLAFCGMIYGFAPLIPSMPMALATYLGATSMAIYVMHVIPEAATRIGLVRLGGGPVWLHVIVGTLAGIGLPLLAYEVLKRLGLLRLFGLGRDRRGAVRALSPS